jgi:hypothetical protein
MLPPWLPSTWCYSGCFCNMRIPERQSVSYMVLALYIFGYHTNLQVIVPVLIIRITALYKLTGVCLLFSYTWIGQQTNHLISVDELLGSYLFSFKEAVLNWVCGIWIYVFCAQFDLFSWCSENSDLSSLRLSIALLTTQWCSQYISSLYCKRHSGWSWKRNMDLLLLPVKMWGNMEFSILHWKEG